MRETLGNHEPIEPMMSVCRVWWWNSGAFSREVPVEMVAEVQESLRESGYMTWQTAGPRVSPCIVEDEQIRRLLG